MITASESEAGGTCVSPGPGVKVQCVIRTQGTRGVVVPVETALSTQRRRGRGSGDDNDVDNDEAGACSLREQCPVQ